MDEGIRDRYNFVYYTVYIIGLTILLPWNILITVSGFWDHKFRNVSLDDETTADASKTELQLMFGSYVAIASNVPNAIFVILHAIFGHKIDMRLRVMGSQVGLIIVLGLITLLAILNSDEWQHLFLGLILSAIVLVNVFSAIFQGSVSSLLSPFPHEYMGNWVNGAGMAGLLPAIVNVLIISIDSNPQVSGVSCFVASLIVSIFCLGMSLRMEKTDFFQFYNSKRIIVQQQNSGSDGWHWRTIFEIYASMGLSVWIYIAITVMNFTVTLCVFPAVCVLVEPAYADPEGDWAKYYYVAVSCFVVFNLADDIGKYSAVWLQVPGPSKRGQIVLLIATISRFALIPLIMLTNVAPNNERRTEIVFKDDAYYITFVSLLGLTNGYIGNIAMMFGPKSAKNHQETAAAAMIAALVIGCGLGSVISNGLVKML